MPSVITSLANLLSLIIMPFLLTGLIVRVKARWAGRKGPPLLQPAHDAIRLFRKSSVYSRTTTPVFRVAPWVFLLTALGSALVVPLAGARPIAGFRLDFVWFAYAWGLGRVAVMLAALDTGSPFEGMGASREATFSSLLEPALFLAGGALCLTSGSTRLYDALSVGAVDGGVATVVRGCAAASLLIALQVESSRMPVDDPTTHLELTMVHEVMVLDHSGPDLAAIQIGSAVKLLVGSSFVASLVNPWAGSGGPLAVLVHLALCAAVAVLVGTVESIIARFKLRAVPQYIVASMVMGAVALLATSWRPGAP